jgi:hypothetical protein
MSAGVLYFFTINPAAPEGTPQWRTMDLKKLNRLKNFWPRRACGEALRRGTLIKFVFEQFSWLECENIVSPAQQVNIHCEPVHPLSRFPREMDRIADTLVNAHSFCAGNEVVGMGDHFFFGRPRHAVAGREAEQGAFIGGEAGSGMTFHDPC